MMRTILLLLVVALAPDVLAGVLVIHERTTIEGPDAKTFEATQYYGDRKLATDGPRQRTVIDLDAKTMTAVDKKAQAYAVTTFDDTLAQKEPARKIFDSLPPELRKRQLAEDVKVTVKPTGRKESIAGYPTTEYVIDAGPMQGSIWVTEKLEMPAAKREWDKLSPSLRPISRLQDRFADAVAGLKGVPLRKVVTHAVKEGEPPRRELTEALSISTEAPPADMLAVPDGFTKWTLPQLGR